MIALGAKVEPSLIAGVSAALASEAELPQAFADAVDCIELARRSEVGATWVDDAWAELTLARLRRRVEQCLPTSHPIAALSEPNRPAGRDLLRSIASYLSCNQDTQRTAAQLCLHPNTLRYRLRRARDLSGLDLSDPAQRLVAELVLGR